MENIINNSLKTLLTGFIILTFSHDSYADDELIPLEHFACYSNQNSFSISPDGKHMLIQNTKEAVEQGVFGAPTFIANNKVFWGQDRIAFALTEARK